MITYTPPAPWLGPYPRIVVDSFGTEWEARGQRRLKKPGSEKPCGAIVYLLAGQSNARGASKLEDLSSSYAFLNTPFPSVSYAEATASRNTGQINFNLPCTYVYPRSNGIFGPELTLSRCLFDKEADTKDACETVVLLKFASPASNIGQWLESDTTGLASAFRQWLNDTMNVLRVKFCDVECRDMFWVQGESDANQELVDGYVGKFLALQSEINLVCDFNPVFSMLPTNSGTARDPFAATINTQVAAAGIDHTVSNNDLVLFDNLHYDADSTAVLGRRLCDATI